MKESVIQTGTVIGNHSWGSFSYFRVMEVHRELEKLVASHK